MSEVGRVTPGKPIWPEHHGEIPERAPHREQEREDKAKKRPPPPEAESEEEQAPDKQEPGTHFDEYV